MNLPVGTLHDDASRAWYLSDEEDVHRNGTVSAAEIDIRGALVLGDRDRVGSLNCVVDLVPRTVVSRDTLFCSRSTVRCNI